MERYEIGLLMGYTEDKCQCGRCEPQVVLERKGSKPLRLCKECVVDTIYIHFKPDMKTSLLSGK